MAAQVEVQTGEVGRTVVGGRLHLSPLTDSSNSLIEINQSHIITPEPNKPVPGPKPRLTPKPFAVERNTTIKPIVAPKPHTKPRPESTRLVGYKPELCSPKPQQPSKPRPVSTNPNRPASTSFKTPNKTGQTTKPVVQPFKPAPSLDPSKPATPVPAERQKPAASSLAYSKSLRKLPAAAAAAEWSGTTKKEDEKDQLTSSKGGTSITRAKSMGFLAQVGQDEEEKAKPVAAVPMRPHPRGSRPRPVSAIFLDSPTKAEPPVPAPRWVGRRPLSADLTSRFESIGLSLHRKTPTDTKENTPESAPQKKEPEKTATSSTPQSTEGEAKPAASDQSNKKTEEVKETEEDKRAVSIKSRISLLLDSSSSPGAGTTGQGSDLSPVQPVPEAEPAVGVKQLIKQLTEDTTPIQSPVPKPPPKPRPLLLDLTKRFSSERSPDFGSEATDRHDISKDPQRRIEDSPFSPSDQRTFVDLKDSQEQLKKASTPEGPEAGQTFGATSKDSAPGGDVQTVRAALFENVVERRSVLMVDDGKPVSKAKDSLSSPSFKRGSGEDEGTLVTATYKEPASPSGPLRVLHAFDTVQAVEENRAVSENIPSAQREDKAMTLRSRRSEGSRTGAAQGEPALALMPDQQPRYLRVGALQKWNNTGLEQEAGGEKGMLKDPRREEQVSLDKDRQREAEQEDVAASPKRLKMLQAEEQPKPRATYFALTGQMQDPFSPVHAGASIGDMSAPFDDFSMRSAPGSSQGKVLPARRNPSLEEAFGKTAQDQVEELMMRSHVSHGDIRSAEETERYKAKLKELEREKQRQLEMEKEAHLEFERMKEMEKQRQFERQRQKAYEEEKQRALERQKQQELERQERERQRQQMERQKKIERERQREQERQRELDKERRLLELQREKQKMEELERIKELDRLQLLESQKQKQKEKERLREKEREEAGKSKQMALEQEMLRLRELEKERERQREMEKERQKEMERQRQRDLERERQRQQEIERERQRQQEIERERQRQQEIERERQRQQEIERERQRQQEIERERQRQLETERERQRQLEMERQESEKQRLREKKEREEAEKIKQMALEQEMLRLRELEKERERQREMEKERLKEMERQKQKELERQRQRDLERERQRQLDIERQELENQRLRREQETERQRKEEMERLREIERRQLLEFERQQILELEKRRLREKMEREEAEKMRQIAKQQEAERQRLKEKQKKEEQERARSEPSPLRPKGIDLDSLLWNDPFSKAAPQRSDPATRWKEPSPRAEESYKPSILDIDSFTSPAQLSPSKDLFSVSGIQSVDTGFGARLQPERDISWKAPPQTSGGFTSPVWTTSPQDPWELRPVEVPAEPRKPASKLSPEQLLLRQEERLMAPQRHRSTVLDEMLLLAGMETKPGGTPGGVSSAEQIWIPRETQPQDVRSHRRSQGSQELNRMRSRSVSRRSAPSSSAVEGSLSRMRSRSAHREQDRHSWVQQKQSNGAEEEGRDAETPVRETDSQYGTWETGLRTDDSLTPATPSSDSNLSPSPRKPTPPHTPGDHASQFDTDTLDGLPPSSDSQPLSFPDAPAVLLDTSALRSRAQLGKKRAPRTRPSRAARQSAALGEGEGGANEDWLYRDSTEAKVESKDDESDSEEQTRGADAGPAVSSQPQRVALFPGMDPSALKAQLKKRADSDNQVDGPAPSSSQLSRSPKSPFLPRAARVLPPPGGKENGEEDSPQWLKELKNKKRLSQYEQES